MKKVLIWSVCVSAVMMVQAAEHSMTNSDAYGDCSFIYGKNWDDGQAPTAGNTYRSAKLLRTPEDSVDYVFAGDQLTMDTGSTFAWKSQGILTVSNLVFNGGTLSHWMSGAGRLFGDITVNAGKLWRISASEPNARWFDIYAPISGDGNIEIQLYQTITLKQVNLLGDNSGFTGQIQLRGQGKFGICAEEALGSEPATFTYNNLDFGGTTLIITNSLTLDDPNRGLNLNTLTSGENAPGGVFEVDNLATATVACVISGAGPLTKRGDGTLVLATNDTYTGVTTVEEGMLRLDPEGSLASPALVVAGATSVVSGEGTLGDVTLVDGGLMAVEKGGWDLGDLIVSNTTEATFSIDLAEANPATTLIRMSGTLSKQPLQVFQFVVNTNNTTAVPYKVLSAPNLSDFADYDFCVNPPWIGQLSRADDGLGGEVLLFTPTPPEKIITKVQSDDANYSAFTLGEKWSDGMVPSVDKSYLYNNGYTFRTPQTGSLTFGGGRLIIDKSATLALKGAGTPTVTNFVMMNDSYLGMWDGAGSRMAGDILLYPLLESGKKYSMRVSSANMGRDLDLYSTLSGYGDLILTAVGDSTYDSTSYRLFGDNTNYFGKIWVEGNTNTFICVTSEDNIGGVPPVFLDNQLTFNGGGLYVTNSVILDDATRGITLLANGGTSSTGSGGGSFTNGTPVELRRYEGGCRLHSYGADTLTVNCPITGPGTLIKNGTGALVLGGENSYTGLTEIIAGNLEPVSANALGTGPVLLRPEGRLLRRYPGATMPNGVELGGPITFESGSAVLIELEDGQELAGNFTVPLFLLADGESVDPLDVPIEHDFTNYSAVVSTSVVESRMLVSVTLTYEGTILLLQ